jgi:hypothetical protein
MHLVELLSVIMSRYPTTIEVKRLLRSICLETSDLGVLWGYVVVDHTEERDVLGRSYRSLPGLLGNQQLLLWSDLVASYHILLIKGPLLLLSSFLGSLFVTDHTRLFI